MSSENVDPAYGPVLRHREHLKHAEIAALLGRSVDAVQSLWWRAIEQFRRELGADS